MDGPIHYVLQDDSGAKLRSGQTTTQSTIDATTERDHSHRRLRYKVGGGEQPPHHKCCTIQAATQGQAASSVGVWVVRQVVAEQGKDCGK
jgi:hypothetical protein